MTLDAREASTASTRASTAATPRTPARPSTCSGAADVTQPCTFVSSAGTSFSVTNRRRIWRRLRVSGSPGVNRNLLAHNSFPGAAITHLYLLDLWRQLLPRGAHPSPLVHTRVCG